MNKINLGFSSSETDEKIDLSAEPMNKRYKKYYDYVCFVLSLDDNGRRFLEKCDCYFMSDQGRYWLVFNDDKEYLVFTLKCNTESIYA
jgi:hypothetical protein